jgi:thiamine-phosphate pyrophosphorylase
MRLDPFYPIVPSARWVGRLADLGVRTMQLRAKDLSADDADKIVKASLDRVAGKPVALIINDYWQAAIDHNAAWVHLGQGDLADADVPAIRRAGIKLGISTHDHDELETALGHDPDYVALGPVYETTLKEMPWAPQGLDRVREWAGLVSCPLVAIGGITLERAEDVWQAGARSLSVVTDIINAFDANERVRTWLEWAATKHT